MTKQQPPLRIDIVSDVVCPWCIVGYRQLQQALADTGVAHEIHWHPFELNPTMSTEGQNLAEHIAEKYGASPAESQANRASLTKIGASLGFEFAFSDDMRMHNTFNAHQLLYWAHTQDLGNVMEEALFTAHFTHRRNLSDIAVLARIAAEIGLDEAEARAVLDDQRYAAEVRKAETFWTGQGIRGVPAVVFDRQHLVTGAQGVENFSAILRQITAPDLAAAD